MKAPLLFQPPAGWAPSDAPTISLPEGSDVAVDAALGWRAPAGQGRAALACMGMDLSTWTEEVAPVALDRADATLGAVAARMQPGLALHVVREEHEGVDARWLSPRDGPDIPVARTAVGFVTRDGHARLDACFVLCAPSDAPCEASIATSTTTGFVAPPPVAAWLSAVVYGAHHPKGVATGAVTLFVLAGVVAVWKRPRGDRK